MHRRTILTSTAALTAAAVSLRQSDVFARQKTPKGRMVGGWELVSIADTLPDGSKVKGGISGVLKRLIESGEQFDLAIGPGPLMDKELEPFSQ